MINLASQAGRRGEALVAHDCASKAAVISYTQIGGAGDGAARHPRQRDRAGSDRHADVGQGGRAVRPHERLQPGEKKVAVGKAVPLGHMGAPDDIAGAAVFLASAESSYITAQTLNVDGGNVMS